ncbi:GGDEF domain-containing protein [Clostridium formicaceticum]|nr:GGDEF domain-containing protein [Clostridium formicaceticum]ARE89062.1 Diguanylate cyclase DosC [Clostridium formicaceticum]
MKKYCKLLKEKDKEILQLKKELVVWRKQASLDQMTGTMNKIEGFKKLQCEMKRALITKENITVAFIDIDRLKEVNDRLGHCAGDQLLVDVSNILKRNVRKEDFIFRFGGDEFVVVFPNTEQFQAKKIWVRICNKIEKFNTQRNLMYSISLSAGFYEYCYNKKLTLKEFIQLADLDMYREKCQKQKEF